MLTIEQNEEKLLLLRVSEGDEKAFTELFNTWSGWLVRFVYRLTDSAIIADEILQDVFMIIWKNRETLAEINHFKSFLLVVSRNQAYMALRKKVREERNLSVYKEETRHTFTNDSDSDYFDAFDEAINQLSARAKEVYLLSRHERLTYQEIAEKLGISKESVKTYLQRATASIVAHLQDKSPELLLLVGLNMYVFF